jgi:hypothetical protein
LRLITWSAAYLPAGKIKQALHRIDFDQLIIADCGPACSEKDLF